MLTASEARVKTQNNINNCNTKELERLKKQIDIAIHEGQFSVLNEGYLEPATRNKLEELGYTVTTGNQYNESYYHISWQ